MCGRPLYRLVVLLLAVAAPAMAVPINIDFGRISAGPVYSPTAPGYTACNAYLDGNSAPRYGVTTPGYTQQLTLADGVIAGWLSTARGFTATDRGATYTDLLRDFCVTGSSTTPFVFKMSGLTPGSYEITVYSTDPQYHSAKGTFVVNGVTFAAGDTQKGATPVVTRPITVASDGLVSLSIVAASNSGSDFGVINAFDLVAVPEPVSLALLGMGGGLMFARRRR